MLKKRQDFHYITKPTEYSEVFAKGKYWQTQLFTIKYQSSEGLHFGVIVSKKCGNAVSRHRIKRLVREVFLKNKELQFCDLKAVIIAKPEVRGASYFDVEQLIKRELFKINDRIWTQQ